MRKKGQCLSSINTSLLRSVGPSPDMNTATIVDVSLFLRGRGGGREGDGDGGAFAASLE